MQRPPPNPFLFALLDSAPSHEKRLRDLYSSLTPAWGWIVLAPTAESLVKYESSVFTEEVVGTRLRRWINNSEPHHQNPCDWRQIAQRQEQEPTLYNAQWTHYCHQR
jgi:hypothetical protein